MVRTLLSILAKPRFAWTAFLVFVIYFLLYLIATQQLVFSASFQQDSFTLLPAWRELLFRRRGFFFFEAVGSLSVGSLQLFLSPLNLLIALLLSALVACNIAASYWSFQELGLRGGRGATSLLATVPAIVSGTACCVPTLILILGLQLSAFLSTLWSFFLPLSFLLLLLSLWWVLRGARWRCTRSSIHG